MSEHPPFVCDVFVLRMPVQRPFSYADDFGARSEQDGRSRRWSAPFSRVSASAACALNATSPFRASLSLRQEHLRAVYGPRQEERKGGLRSAQNDACCCRPPGKGAGGAGAGADSIVTLSSADGAGAGAEHGTAQGRSSKP